MRPGRGAGENSSPPQRCPRDKPDPGRKYPCPSGCVCIKPSCPNRTVTAADAAVVAAADKDHSAKLVAARAARTPNKPVSPVRTCQRPRRSRIATAKKWITNTFIALTGMSVGCLCLYNHFKSPVGAELADATARAGFDPCCAYPCQHHGVCTSQGPNYECDCTGTGYRGKLCEKPTWRRWVIDMVRPSSETLMELPGNYPSMWKFINNVPFLHRRFMKVVYWSRCSRVPMPTRYSTGSDYITLDNYFNRTNYARFLPPVPKNCPTAMGVHGPKKLPAVDDVFERVFRRRHFIPCHKGTNMYFATYAQFFTHQFFKTDQMRGPGITYGNSEGVDISNVYGQSERRRNALRSFQDGKLKTAIVDGEDVVPYLHDAPDVLMAYPKGVTMDQMMEETLMRQDRNVAPMWAMGHPLFSMTPLLFVMATLWLREHNRVCDVLKAEHADWDDERLYQTSRLIMTGLMIKMTITEYVQHLSQYHIHITYEPDLTHGTSNQYQNRIFLEFAHLYHWHMLTPDVFRVEEHTHRFRDLMFSNNSDVFRHGFNRFLASMFLNIAGKMTTRNHGELSGTVMKSLLKHSRATRTQSFNNYRRSFDLPPYEDFMQLTSDPDLASDLRQIYGEVEAVELLVGLFAEKHTYSVTPPTMVMIGGSWSVKGLIANPVGTPGWWKPSTFGGRKGWDIIRRTTLKDFVCRNLRGSGCSKMHIAYTVPDAVLEAAQRQAIEQSKPPVLREQNATEEEEVVEEEEEDQNRDLPCSRHAA